MAIGIVGRKRGMMQIFTEEGRAIPVSVIEASPNRVVQLMEPEKHGYRGVQLTWGDKKKRTLSKAEAGVFIKRDILVGEGLIEYRLDQEEKVDLSPGTEIGVGFFTAGQRVDVVGTTKGKGFSGVIKRHHFSSQRMTHGNSISHRAPGSIGQCQTPGRVFKGKKMAGQLGNTRRTVQNLELVQIDEKRNLLLIKGAVPVAKGGKVMIKPAVKKTD